MRAYAASSFVIFRTATSVTESTGFCEVHVNCVPFRAIGSLARFPRAALRCALGFGVEAIQARRRKRHGSRAPDNTCRSTATALRQVQLIKLLRSLALVGLDADVELFGQGSVRTSVISFAIWA